jgi:hypothetical protein
LGHYNPDYDIPEGEIGEDIIRDLFSGRPGSVEVKRDTIVSDSGNIAVEFEYRDRPSGIRATNAKWWVILLSGENYQDNLAIVVLTERLRTMCEWLIENGDKSDCTTGGDDNQSKMVLLHLNRLLLWNPTLVRVGQGAIR